MAVKTDGPVDVRAKIDVGTWYNQSNIKRGDVLTVPNLAEAQRLFKLGYAQPLSEPQLGRPYEPYIA